MTEGDRVDHSPKIGNVDSVDFAEVPKVMIPDKFPGGSLHGGQIQGAANEKISVGARFCREAGRERISDRNPSNHTDTWGKDSVKLAAVIQFFGFLAPYGAGVGGTGRFLRIRGIFSRILGTAQDVLGENHHRVTGMAGKLLGETPRKGTTQRDCDDLAATGRHIYGIRPSRSARHPLPPERRNGQ